jgi:hypothetical protein
MGFCVKSLAIIKHNNEVLGLYDLTGNFGFQTIDMLGLPDHFWGS